MEGLVTDASGAAVPGAAVMLVNNATGVKMTAATTSVGYDLFPSLPAAVYTLTVSAQGFRANEITDLRLEIGERRTSNVSLQLGTQATSVSVRAESAAVDLSQASISTVIESKMLTDLPLAGRNFLALAMTTPGVTGVSVPADVFGGETQLNINVGGQRGEQNGFSVDSGTVSSMVRHGRTNLQPNAESVQELQVSVNDFSASHGNDAGGTIKVLTRSGSNTYHGSVSWFHEDNVLSSRNLFQSTINPSTGRALPVSRRNEVAGSFGGPLRKNRTFLFASFDILRQTIGASATSTVETPDFVNFVAQKFPNNKSAYLLKSEAAAFAPAQNVRTAGSLLGANCTGSDLITSPIGPIPCNLNVLGDGVTPIPGTRNPYQWSVRGDHMIGNADRLYVSVFRDAEKSNSLSILSRPATLYTYPILNWYGNVNETHPFSPNLINEFRATVTRVHGEISCQDLCDIPLVTLRD